MTPFREQRGGWSAWAAGATLGLLIGLGTTTRHVVRRAHQQAVLHQLGLEDRAADIRGVTAGDFNADGWGPDYRADFADGSIEYFLHRGYAAYRA